LNISHAFSRAAPRLDLQKSDHRQTLRPNAVHIARTIAKDRSSPTVVVCILFMA
jgi:hypothetical protein